MKIPMQILILCLLFFLAIPLGTVFAFGNLRSGEQAVPQGAKTEATEKDGASTKNKVELPEKIKVFKENQGKTVSVNFEEYVACVTASEMPNTFESEALKAQSVAARTFAYAKLEKYQIKKPAAHPEAPICSTTHCQVYKTEEELAECHPKGWGTSEAGYPKIKAASEATAGELLYYDGEPIMQPLFFSSSGGQTENSEDVFVSALPYLVSVSSPYESNATHQNEEKTFTLGEFEKALIKAYPEKAFGALKQSNIKILSRTAGGRVDKMQIGDGTLKGTEVRNALGLSSALFSISFDNAKNGEGQIIFTSNGSGHGVGMSQYGADGMAKEGYDYKEILKHYYSGAEIY